MCLLNAARRETTTRGAGTPTCPRDRVRALSVEEAVAGKSFILCSPPTARFYTIPQPPSEYLQHGDKSNLYRCPTCTARSPGGRVRMQRKTKNENAAAAEPPPPVCLCLLKVRHRNSGDPMKGRGGRNISSLSRPFVPAMKDTSKGSWPV